MVYGVFKDPVLLSKLEADFCQYYHIDIRDLFVPESRLTVREIHDKMIQLPTESRIFQYLNNDRLTLDQHLSTTAIDLLRDISYQMAIVAMGTIGNKDYKQAMKKAPKPLERPKFVQTEEDKPKKKFLTGRELMGVVERKKTVIAHTPACVKSKVNEGGGEIRCGCPEEIVK